MFDFFNSFSNNRYWFMGTIIVVSFIGLFFWHLTDPEGYTREINSWFQSIKLIFYNILSLVIVGIVVGVVIKGVFKRGK